MRVDQDLVVFAHPLLAFVPYDEASTTERRRLHARLARVVPDAEERARHLALAATGPDERVATELDRAARRALARGAPDAAAELVASRAAPDAGVRRRAPDGRGRVHLREWRFGARSRADGGSRRPSRCRPAPCARRYTAGLVSRHLGDDPHGALELLDGAREEARGDLAVEVEVLECLTWQCHDVGRHDDAARYARLGAAAAEELGDPQWIVLLGMAVAHAEGKVGRAAAARRAVARVEGMSGAVAPLRVINDPAWVRALFLASDGDLEGALVLIRQLHERALELGDESSLPGLLEFLALFEFRAGNWQRADEIIDTALEIAVRTDQEIQRLTLRPWRAVLDAHLGRVESARVTAQRRFQKRASVGCPRFGTWRSGR